jgi:hypothetical protein
MSHTIAKPEPAAKPGPAFGDVEQISATFLTEAALQDAISRLTLAGFDRADISRPVKTTADVTPEQGVANPNTPTDQQQMRTIHTSMAGAVGAVAAAGVTIATGGAAAVAVGAAVLAGAGAGLVANRASNAVDVTSISTADSLLMLTVRTGSDERTIRAHDALEQAAAHSIQHPERRISA